MALDTSCGSATTPAGIGCIAEVVRNIVNAGFLFIGVVVLFLIIFSGFQIVTSGGESKQLEGARKTITYALIGLVITLGSYFIVNIIAQVTGVGCITHFFDFTGSFCQ